MEDTTAIVTATTDHCAPVTKAALQQAPGYEEEAGGWDIGTGSAGWNPQSAAAAMELPVLTQPGLGVTKTTVTTITQTGGDWNSSLFNVCGDKTTCLLGAFVPCCLDLSLAHHYGECLCLPLLPGSTFAMRVGIRERYKIRLHLECFSSIIEGVPTYAEHLLAAFPSLCGPTHSITSQLACRVIVEARSSDAALHHSPSWSNSTYTAWRCVRSLSF
ncbi:uncharacterized protein LOC118390860 isoform X2 [Oncorhynchus keta]|nr:uncharacterized protein LOC118390860 isoform X2 [Oncorhynchus keta]